MMQLTAEATREFVDTLKRLITAGYEPGTTTFESVAGSRLAIKLGVPQNKDGYRMVEQLWHKAEEEMAEDPERKSLNATSRDDMIATIRRLRQRDGSMGFFAIQKATGYKTATLQYLLKDMVAEGKLEITYRIRGVRYYNVPGEVKPGAHN